MDNGGKGNVQSAGRRRGTGPHRAVAKPGAHVGLGKRRSAQQHGAGMSTNFFETLTAGGATAADETTTPFGIRTLRFDPDEGFFLNGAPMKFMGVCIHHDAGCLGAVPDTGPAWKEIVVITNPQGENIAVNEYYAARPEMMLGEMRLAGRMYAGGEPTLVGYDRPLAEQLAEAVARFLKDVFRAETRRATPQVLAQSFPAPEHIKPNAYALVNDQLAMRDADQLRAVTDLSSQAARRIRGLIRVRDAVRGCLRSQLNGALDEDVVAARDELNRTYDGFVARLGPISERANVVALRGDPDLPLLLSLEQYDPESGRATKAAIFHERTIQRHRPIPQVSTPRESLLVTLNERGSVDLDFMATLLHRPPSEFLPELKGTIFLNPQAKCWETEDEYLSGNVRAKLAVAEAAALADEQFKEHVAVLRQVQPADLNATEIVARLGSTWVPADDVKQLAETVLGEEGINVSHAPELGLWVVRGGYSVRFSVANTTEWGTDRRSGLDLIEDALNLRVPTIYDPDPDIPSRHQNGGRIAYHTGCTCGANKTTLLCRPKASCQPVSMFAICKQMGAEGSASDCSHGADICLQRQTRLVVAARP
jgi:hypothetical protein